MGANQSGVGGQMLSSSSGDGSSGRAGGILVVNPTPGARQPDDVISLPKRVPPILYIEGNQIEPSRHKPDLDQLNPAHWVDFVSVVGEFASSRSELTATRQSQLQEKIIQIDNHVQRFTDSYLEVKHKALARMNDDCKKVDEIDKLLQKCTMQSELCANMLNKLNFLLPEGDKLEPLELS